MFRDKQIVPGDLIMGRSGLPIQVSQNFLLASIPSVAALGEFFT